jgi:hypothetical protein
MRPAKWKDGILPYVSRFVLESRTYYTTHSRIQPENANLLGGWCQGYRVVGV